MAAINKIQISASVVNDGIERIAVAAYDSTVAGNILTFAKHVGGVWNYDSSLLDVDNTHTDNGTDLVVANQGNYVVRWIYRLVDSTIKQVFYVSGATDYVTREEADNEEERTDLPALITDRCILVGRMVFRANFVPVANDVENVERARFARQINNLKAQIVGPYDFANMLAVVANSQELTTEEKVSALGIGQILDIVTLPPASPLSFPGVYFVSYSFLSGLTAVHVSGAGTDYFSIAGNHTADIAIGDTIHHTSFNNSPTNILPKDGAGNYIAAAVTNVVFDTVNTKIYVNEAITGSANQDIVYSRGAFSGHYNVFATYNGAWEFLGAPYPTQIVFNNSAEHVSPPNPSGVYGDFLSWSGVFRNEWNGFFIPHNNLDPYTFQGGSVTERFHLTLTQHGYVAGFTSDPQTQLNAKVDNNTLVNSGTYLRYTRKAPRVAIPLPPTGTNGNGNNSVVIRRFNSTIAVVARYGGN